MKVNKFWNCLKAIANLFDFVVIIKFEDGRVVDFDIQHSSNLLEGDLNNET